MNISTLIDTALDSERFSDEYKNAWRSIFVFAKQKAKCYSRRDLDAKQLVDIWLSYHQTDLPHASPDDDALCDDMSCIQALSQQQAEFLNDIRDEYIKALRSADDRSLSLKQRKEFLNIAKRLRKLWREENATNIKEVAYDLYEEMPDSVVYYETYKKDDIERYVDRQEAKLNIYQEPECDPEDSHYVADTTRYNRGKPRGNIGLLNGLYEQTLPEPAYRTPEGRRSMLRALRTSDNSQDIELYFSLTQPHRRNETDEQWAIKVQKRRKLRDAYIQQLSS